MMRADARGFAQARLAAVFHKGVADAHTANALSVEQLVVAKVFQHGGTEAAGKAALLHNDNAPETAGNVGNLGFGQGLEPDGIKNQRRNAALFGEFGGSTQGGMHPAAHGDDGDLGTILKDFTRAHGQQTRSAGQRNAIARAARKFQEAALGDPNLRTWTREDEAFARAHLMDEHLRAQKVSFGIFPKKDPSAAMDFRDVLD